MCLFMSGLYGLRGIVKFLVGAKKSPVLRAYCEMSDGVHGRFDRRTSPNDFFTVVISCLLCRALLIFAFVVQF
jgi:hypothetical protein